MPRVPGLRRVQLAFGTTPPLTSGSQTWFPLSGEETPLDTHLFFIKTTVSKTYRRSAAERILLTPFALVADVVILPVALLTAPLWIPK